MSDPKFRNRIKEFRRMRAGDLLPNPHNFRMHGKQQTAAMLGALGEVGKTAVLYAFETAEGLMLLDGHLRQGLDPDEEWDVAITDLTPDEAKKLLAVFDAIGAEAEIDPERLAELANQIDLESAALQDLIDKLLAEPKPKQPATEEVRLEYHVLIPCQTEQDQLIILDELDRNGIEARAICAGYAAEAEKKQTPSPVITATSKVITRSIAIKRTPRVKQLEGIFDVPPAKRQERTWHIDFTLDKPWSIGMIVGPSGSGKTTLARELFGQNLIAGWPWSEAESVIDGFPKGMSVHDITGLLSSVGFSSPPSWLKPFHVLSNGEQFRVTLARTLAEAPDLAVVDEFTSVVDRTVAQIGSAAVAKTIRSTGRRLVAVSCHYDIEDWLQPDWKYDTANGQFLWRSLQRRPKIDLAIRRVDPTWWKIFRHHHYLDHDLHRAAKCFVGEINGQPATFTAVLHRPGKTGFWGEHRTVCLPDYQGVGLGNAMSEFVASVMAATGKKYRSTTSHPAMIRHRTRSAYWRMTKAPAIGEPPSSRPRSAETAHLPNKTAWNRATASFEWIGPANHEGATLFGIT